MIALPLPAPTPTPTLSNTRRSASTPQIWIGPYDAILSPANFQAIQNGHAQTNPHGGLWTSPEELSASPRSRSNSFQTYRDPSYSRWRVTPLPSFSFFTVEDQADADYLLTRFPLPWPGKNPQFPLLDWEAVASHYQAVHLTPAGLSALNLGNSPFQGWDCETTLWFHWTFTSVELLERHLDLETRAL